MVSLDRFPSTALVCEDIEGGTPQSSSSILMTYDKADSVLKATSTGFLGICHQPKYPANLVDVNRSTFSDEVVAANDADQFATEIDEVFAALEAGVGLADLADDDVRGLCSHKRRKTFDSVAIFDEIIEALKQEHSKFGLMVMDDYVHYLIMTATELYGLRHFQV